MKVRVSEQSLRQSSRTEARQPIAEPDSDRQSRADFTTVFLACALMWYFHSSCPEKFSILAASAPCSLRRCGSASVTTECAHFSSFIWWLPLLQGGWVFPWPELLRSTVRTRPAPGPPPSP